MTYERAIECLRPVAEFRVMCLNSGGSRWSAREKKRSRQDTETLMIRRLKECGFLPPFLVPLLWKLIYSLMWSAIKYWVNEIHGKDGE